MSTSKKVLIVVGVLVFIALLIWACSWFFGPKRHHTATVATDSTAAVTADRTSNNNQPPSSRKHSSNHDTKNVDFLGSLREINTTIKDGDNGIINAIKGIKAGSDNKSNSDDQPAGGYNIAAYYNENDTKSSSGSGSVDSNYSGNVSTSPNATTFCIYIGSNRFLFWELVNTSNPETIDRLVPNPTGKLANMTLAPGESSAGISYDGATVTIEINRMKQWYQKIFGVAMPENFHPYLRGDKTGWGDREMTKTKGYFALTF